MNRFLLELALSLLGAVVTFGLPWLLWRWLRSGRPSPTPLPIARDDAGRHLVPLVAAFTGIRGLPWIGLAHNSLDPRLVLGPGGIACRVLRTRTYPYAEIAEVDVRSFGATVLLGFAFHGSAFTFDANVGSTVLARRVLALLPPSVRLSGRARALADDSPPAGPAPLTPPPGRP